MERKELILHVAENLKNGLGELDGLECNSSSLNNDCEKVYFGSCEYYSLKPRTHIVNGFEVPAPMEFRPGNGETYFHPHESCAKWFEADVWDGRQYDERSFERNSCFATKEAAIANAKARCGIDPNKE